MCWARRRARRWRRSSRRSRRMTPAGAWRASNAAPPPGGAPADARAGWQPSLGLELALMDAIQAGTEAPGRATSPPHPPRASSPAAGPERKSAPPPTAPPAPKKAGAPPAEGAVTAKALAENWEAILGAAHRLVTRTQALLPSGKLLGIRGGGLIVGFPTEILRE